MIINLGIIIFIIGMSFIGFIAYSVHGCNDDKTMDAAVFVGLSVFIITIILTCIGITHPNSWNIDFTKLIQFKPSQSQQISETYKDLSVKQQH